MWFINYQRLQGPKAHGTLPIKERLILQTTVPHLDPTMYQGVSESYTWSKIGMSQVSGFHSIS